MIAVIRVCAGSPPQGAAAITRQVRDLLAMTNPEEADYNRVAEVFASAEWLCHYERERRRARNQYRGRT
eukprot:5933229-Amphidinium_carterae.1